ncbi:hypothetical protein D3C85_1285290 [compost metagenome]
MRRTFNIHHPYARYPRLNERAYRVAVMNRQSFTGQVIQRLRTTRCVGTDQRVRIGHIGPGELQVCFIFGSRDNRGYDIDFARFESLSLLVNVSPP